MPFQRAHDPGRPGLLLLRDGEPVAGVIWAHDFAERAQTGWFLMLLGPDGEPDGDVPWRLSVARDVELLAADTALSRADWLARAETIELVTATAAVEEAERLLGG